MSDAERIAALESHLASANERISELAQANAELSKANVELLRDSTEGVRRYAAKAAELQRERERPQAVPPKTSNAFGPRVVERPDRGPRQRFDPEKEFQGGNP